MRKIGVSQVNENNILWCENFFRKNEIFLLTLGYPCATITKLTRETHWIVDFEVAKKIKKVVDMSEWLWYINKAVAKNNSNERW